MPCFITPTIPLLSKHPTVFPPLIEGNNASSTRQSQQRLLHRLSQRRLLHHRSPRRVLHRRSQQPFLFQPSNEGSDPFSRYVYDPSSTTWSLFYAIKFNVVIKWTIESELIMHYAEICCVLLWYIYGLCMVF